MFDIIIGVWLALQIAATQFVVSDTNSCFTALISPEGSHTYLVDISIKPHQKIKEGCGRLLNDILFVHWVGDESLTAYSVTNYTFIVPAK